MLGWKTVSRCRTPGNPGVEMRHGVVNRSPVTDRPLCVEVLHLRIMTHMFNCCSVSMFLFFQPSLSSLLQAFSFNVNLDILKLHCLKKTIVLKCFITVSIHVLKKCPAFSGTHQINWNLKSCPRYLHEIRSISLE